MTMTVEEALDLHLSGEAGGLLVFPDIGGENLLEAQLGAGVTGRIGIDHPGDGLAAAVEGLVLVRGHDYR